MRQLLFSFAILLSVSSATLAKGESTAAAIPVLETKATAHDIQIIHRAYEILSDKVLWNRKDDRHCHNNMPTFSLYCALYKASIEIDGKFDHRSPALEEVRKTVEEFSKGKIYEHRLMGYNNDPTTSFENVKKVLQQTETKLTARLQK